MAIMVMVIVMVMVMVVVLVLVLVLVIMTIVPESVRQVDLLCQCQHQSYNRLRVHYLPKLAQITVDHSPNASSRIYFSF